MKAIKVHYVLMLALVLGLLAFGQVGCKKEAGEVGTQGIVIEQISGAPPSQVSKGQEFQIMITLENKGNYDLKQGEAQIFLEGLDPLLYSIPQTDIIKTNTLELKSANNEAGIAGGRERIVFANRAKYIGQNADFDQSISYASCYFYESTVQTNICFALQEGVCTLEGDKIKDATIGDAPIQITSITEERIGQNVQVKFKIENKGDGRVFSPEANCEAPELFLEDSVLVSVQSEEPFDCRPTLDSAKEGEGRINSIIACKRNMQGTSDHISPVKIKLRYKYLETSKTTLKVTE